MRVVAVVSRPVGASRASASAMNGVSSVRRGPSANARLATHRRGRRRATSIAGSNDAVRARRVVFHRALRTGREETAAEDAARAREALRVQPEEETETETDDASSTGSWRVVSKTTVVDGVTAVGFKTRGRQTFEVEYGAKKGTTENSYVTRGRSATCVFDAPDGRYSKRFAVEMESVPGARDAVFFAMLHVSPRRLDSLAAYLANRTNGAECVEVLCSNPGAQLIQQALKPNNPLTNEALIKAWKDADTGKLRARLRVVRNGERLDLGGKTLRFATAPTPRWPDLVFARDEQTGALLSSKFFSAHVGTMNELSDEGGLETFGEDWRFFYDCLLAPMARQVGPVLARLDVGEDDADATPAAPVPSKANTKKKNGGLGGFVKGLFGGSKNASNEIETPPPAVFEGIATVVCPTHGPIIKSSVAELYREYVEWNEKQISAGDRLSVAIIYASAYGNTGAMAQAIARGVSKTGVAAEMFNCELASPDEVTQLMKRSAGFALGAPTLGGTLPTPVQTALGAIVKDADLDKPCGSFGSFGWSGEAVEMIDKRLKDAGFKNAFDPLRCKFRPTAETLQLCEESGTDLAQAVRKLERRKQVLERKAVGTADPGVSDTAAAVGRIVGSLCAVTTKNEDVQSAMLASWVSQASFNPPALTVAVAKERAVESFLLTGGKFNLNVLKGGGEKDVMKALLKPFAPGENRFGDLDVTISETNGCAVVQQALACIECKVTKRMEAGDHWIVLAEVERGELFDDKGLTAIHHRKSGTNY